MIQLKNVSISLEKHTILRNISFQIQARKTHILLGPSGCGKSTLLKALMGLLPPSTGMIQTQRALNFGYVVQSGGLYPHLTALENIFLPARVLRKKIQTMQDRIYFLAKLVNLNEDQLMLYPRQLSGGQIQRVSLVRALLMDPEVLFLDEPFGALDPIIKRELQLQLKALFEKLQKTVVLVTHDLAEAALLGEWFILLNHGEVVQEGEFNVFKKNPSCQFVKTFFKAQDVWH